MEIKFIRLRSYHGDFKGLNGINDGDQVPPEMLYDVVDDLLAADYNVMLQKCKDGSLILWVDKGTFKRGV